MLQNDCCIRELMELLQTIINQENPFALAFKNMAEVEYAEIRQAAIEGRPVSVAKMSMFEGNGCAPPPSREVVIYPRGQPLKTISSMSANLEPIVYPIFFPRGDAGWHDQLEHNPFRATRVRNHITLSQYYNYRLFIRQTFSPIFYRKKLFQPCAVDAYVKIEGQHHAFIRNKNKLRSEQYDTLHEYVNNTVNNPNVRPVPFVILPFSYVGSPRALKKIFKDAMAIIKKYGEPDLFITFTSNPKWIKITENLNPGESATDRPDLVYPIFKMKLKCFLDNIFKHGVKVVSHVQVIEFQKRGFPHVHILLHFLNDDKLETAEDIISVISAEIPDRTVYPKLFEIAKTCMIHGPCGIFDPNSPCMNDGICTKIFPKEFNPRTVAIFNGYPNYRRLGNDRVAIIKECRFVSTQEALRRIYEYSISDMSHTIIRLQIHLPDNQRVNFNEGEEQVTIDRAAQRDTYLTAWFKLNGENNETRQYSYVEIPYHFVFGKNCKWKVRQRGSDKVIVRQK
ncbi:uncharacterized protein LOC136096730 [Hydra vulgaris]|uniref:uncharacterized protein LOC136096730 n=1 Tax=Hydra vulgaris TaxID=6087 RepID=UPI0032EA7FF8